jgi:hypothetical protein
MFDRDKAIATIEAGRCACPDCKGELTDPKLSARDWGFCKVCRCAWKAPVINGTRYAASIHTKAREPVRRLTEADYDGHGDLR